MTPNQTWSSKKKKHILWETVTRCSRMNASYSVKKISIHNITSSRITLIDMPFIFSSKKGKKSLMEFIGKIVLVHPKILMWGKTLYRKAPSQESALLLSSQFSASCYLHNWLLRNCEYFHYKANQLWNSTLKTTARQFWQTVYFQSSLTPAMRSILYKVNFLYNFKIIQLAHEFF